MALVRCACSHYLEKRTQCLSNRTECSFWVPTQRRLLSSSLGVANTTPSSKWPPSFVCNYRQISNDQILSKVFYRLLYTPFQCVEKFWIASTLHVYMKFWPLAVNMGLHWMKGLLCKWCFILSIIPSVLSQSAFQSLMRDLFAYSGCWRKLRIKLDPTRTKTSITRLFQCRSKYILMTRHFCMLQH